MAYIVDASVAVKWLVTEQDKDAALALLESGLALFTPSFMFVEVSNVLRRKSKAGLISPDDARERLAELPRYFQPLARQPTFIESFDLAMQIDHPVYDCIYLVAARDSRMPLVTADKVLLRKAKSFPQLDIYDLSTAPVGMKK